MDAIQSVDEAGKPTNHDTHKNSFVNILGLDGALDYANTVSVHLMEKLNRMDRPLKEALEGLITQYIHRHISR